MLAEPTVTFSLLKPGEPHGPFPRFRDSVLPVAELSAAVAFYSAVFGLTRLDACGRADFALLGREYTQLSLYAIAGYTPPECADPVLSCTLPPTAFPELGRVIRAYSGAVTRAPQETDAIPRLLFTDPGGSNLIEVRGLLTLAPAYAA